MEGNDFIGNREQVRYVGTKDEDWGGKSGNHWSNYLGWDRDGDGVGDVPYEANDMVDRLTWRYPSMKLLLASPAVQALRLVGQQFPVLRVPSVVDPNPRMLPSNQEWSRMAWQVLSRPVNSAAVSLRGVSKHYGALHAVDGVDLDSPPG